mmetsp:Transcript_13852/g.34190  ORF Transcript_13852/g.34190 Transcript_13852/m.34190 type:complete len:502 (+) Transcript_13852:908-2413(+)
MFATASDGKDEGPTRVPSLRLGRGGAELRIGSTAASCSTDANKKPNRRRWYQTVCVLGSGGFGQVKLVQKAKSAAATVTAGAQADSKDEDDLHDHPEGSTTMSTSYFALKIIEKSHLLDVQLLDPRITDRHQAERDIGVRLDEHALIVTLFETFQSRTKLYYVYEYCDGGELFDLVRVLGRLAVEPFFCFYATEVVEGCSFLHANGILHRDLKLENVLLSADGHVKICDFGCAKFFRCSRQKSTTTTTSVQRGAFPEAVGRTNSALLVSKKSLMPPEYYATPSEYGVELDCWQLGLMFYVMLQGRSIDLYADDLERPLVASDHPEANALVNELLHPDSNVRLGHGDGAEGVKKAALFESLRSDRRPDGRESAAGFWAAVREKKWREPPELPQEAVDKIASLHNDWGRDSTAVDSTNAAELFRLPNFSHRLSQGAARPAALHSLARGGEDSSSPAQLSSDDEEEAETTELGAGSAHPTLLEKTPAGTRAGSVGNDLDALKKE